MGSVHDRLMAKAQREHQINKKLANMDVDELSEFVGGDNSEAIKLLATAQTNEDFEKAAKLINNPKVPKNDLWDEAENCFQQSHTQLSDLVRSVGDQLNDKLNDPVTGPLIANDAVLASTCDALRSDWDSASKSLLDIHAKHEGKSGGATDVDTAIYAAGLIEDYAKVLESHLVVLQGSISAVEMRLGGFHEQVVAAQAAQQEQAQDPTVVTDAVVRMKDENE